MCTWTLIEDIDWIINQTLAIFGMQKFIAVRKEDAGEYYCRAKNDAGNAECPPQLMEVCKSITAAHPESPPHPDAATLDAPAPCDSIPADDIDVVGILLGVLVVIVVLLCITAGIYCAYRRGFFSSQKQTGNK